MILAFAVMALGLNEKDVEIFAMRQAPQYVDEVLKSPSTAKYGVKSVEKAEPSAALVQGRYHVTGYVDAANSFGAPVRGGWAASVRIDGDRPELLMFAWVDGGETKVLYMAPVDRRYRPDLIRSIKEDFRSMMLKIRHQAERVPLKKRKMFLDRNARQFRQDVLTKYDITDAQLSEILGDL